jgi:hypothetical protein
MNSEIDTHVVNEAFATTEGVSTTEKDVSTTENSSTTENASAKILTTTTTPSFESYFDRVKNEFNTFIKEFVGSTETESLYNHLLSLKERIIFHKLCDQHKIYSEGIGNALLKKIRVSKKPLENKTSVTDKDRKMFIKDSSLPIPCYKEPFFTYALQTLDPMFGSIKRFAQYESTMLELKDNKKNLKSEFEKIAEKFVSSVKKLPAYERLVGHTMTATEMELPKKTSRHLTIWMNTDENWPKYYISIDMIKANFSACKWFDESLVMNCQTYEELIKKFTDISFIQESKHLRQILFGKLNGKKIMMIERHLLSHLYKKLNEHIELKILCRMSDDEFVIETTREKIEADTKLINKTISELPEKMRNIWRVTPMFINPLVTGSDCFVKQTICDFADFSKTIKELKCVKKDYFLQAYKIFCGLPINDNDLTIMKDDDVVIFKYPQNFGKTCEDTEDPEADEDPDE